eukprot:36528-Eustigmatos_ZCMA.PRE.1
MPKDAQNKAYCRKHMEGACSGGQGCRLAHEDMPLATAAATILSTTKWILDVCAILGPPSVGPRRR